MEIYNFFKSTVNACNDNSFCCVCCPLQAIKQSSKRAYRSCVDYLFNYFIEKNEIAGQKIYDEFKKLNIVKIPILKSYTGKKTYKQQLKIIERYCKGNSLEIE